MFPCRISRINIRYRHTSYCIFYMIIIMYILCIYIYRYYILITKLYKSDLRFDHLCAQSVQHWCIRSFFQFRQPNPSFEKKVTDCGQAHAPFMRVLLSLLATATAFRDLQRLQAVIAIDEQTRYKNNYIAESINPKAK